MKAAGELNYKIYIDTSKIDEKEVKLVKESEGVVDVVGVKSGKIDITQSIKDLLLENNLKVSDISMFVPNPGPGSFTGLKMGVTISNVLNWVLKRKSLKELDYPEYGGDPNISESRRK
ncbi:hypothetical protein GYA37_00565 [candidate division WWE3 bacterium]|uniref:Gcp-like domain-containing protein n=1 Tax=candidate division WWE3 bacterium TaxID=2053526 RepID=A0A7X9E6E5_UNCKA|nr:hypothetical protein [candidate division WWE3 bacterium]